MERLLRCAEAREIDLVSYLETLGFRPQKISGSDYWYLSPLRPENEPSFKINRRLNAWYDHCLGQGGNLVDFGILYHRCSVGELLQKVRSSFSFHPQKASPVLPETIVEPHLKITATGPLSHPALSRYLQERKISLAVAKRYTEEVHFTWKGKSYYAVGFRNNRGGFELRNRYFKGSSSPKDSTLLEENGATELAVIEGFFSFLSYQTHYQNKPKPLTNFLVLNSLSFFKKNLEVMEHYPTVRLYLDNDPAGDACTRHALCLSKKFKDERKLYRGCNDLNDWLCSNEQPRKQALRPGRSF